MSIKRIAVGLDGSTGSARALDWALSLAKSVGAEIVAVHAADMTAYPVSLEAAAAAPIQQEALDRWHDELRAELEGPWTQPVRDAGVPCRTLLVDGHPAAVLMGMADGEDADLVVVGSRGRGGFRELLLGSVSHQLTHHARRPVVVVPPERR